MDAVNKAHISFDGAAYSVGIRRTDDVAEAMIDIPTFKLAARIARGMFNEQHLSLARPWWVQ